MAVIGIGVGGVYAHQQIQEKTLKIEQTKNSSMSKKIAKTDSKSSNTDKETSSSKQQEETSVSSSSSVSSSEDTSNTQTPVHLTDK